MSLDEDDLRGFRENLKGAIGRMDALLGDLSPG